MSNITGRILRCCPVLFLFLLIAFLLLLLLSERSNLALESLILLEKLQVLCLELLHVILSILELPVQIPDAVVAFKILNHPRLLIHPIDVQVARFTLKCGALAFRLHVGLPLLPADLLTTVSGSLILLFLFKDASVDSDTTMFLFVVGPV